MIKFTKLDLLFLVVLIVAIVRAVDFYVEGVGEMKAALERCECSGMK